MRFQSFDTVKCFLKKFQIMLNNFKKSSDIVSRAAKKPSKIKGHKDVTQIKNMEVD